MRAIYKIYSKIKSSRKVLKRVQYKILEKLDKVYIDLSKSFNVSFINEVKYYILLID